MFLLAANNFKLKYIFIYKNNYRKYIVLKEKNQLLFYKLILKIKL